MATPPWFLKNPNPTGKEEIAKSPNPTLHSGGGAHYDGGGHQNSLSLIFILQLKSQKNEKIVATGKNFWEWQKNDRNLF